jgi:hypothetical protein
MHFLQFECWHPSLLRLLPDGFARSRQCLAFNNRYGPYQSSILM